MGRHIARDQCRADLARLEGTVLYIDRADPGAFGVTKRRQVDGAGDVIFGELGRRTHVDDVIYVQR